MSVSAVVREAIDRGLARTSTEAGGRGTAGAAVLSAPRMPVPDPDELVRELEVLRSHERS